MQGCRWYISDKLLQDDDESYINASTSREETLKWISKTIVRISNFDVLYGNHKAVMGFHMGSVPEMPLSKVMFFARNEHAKFSYQGAPLELGSY